jgi:hypothetical protein
MRNYYINFITQSFILRIGLLIFLSSVTFSLHAQHKRVNQDFNTTGVPAGWSLPLNQGTLTARVATVNSYGRQGPLGAWKADNFTVATPNRALLKTNTFTPTTIDDSLRFDVAHAPYSTADIDSLIIWAYDGLDSVRIAAWGSSPAINTTTGITTAAPTTAAFTPTNQQWTTKTLALPTGTITVGFMFYSGWSNNIYIDHVIVDSFYIANMVYDSCNTYQSNVSNAGVGDNNQDILRLKVDVSGTIFNLNTTEINFTTTGSTNASNDIAAAKVYYTGNSPYFSTNTLFGTINLPSGSFTVTGNQALVDGPNYFWLSYDISDTAIAGNVVDATCENILIDGIYRYPTTTDPTGSRTVVAYTQVGVSSAGNVVRAYQNLEKAVAKINQGTHTGDIVVTVNSNTTETNPIVLNGSGTGSANYTSVIIRPADTATTVKTVSTNVSGITLFTLSGADSVTIDGRPNGTGSLNRLTFSHLSNTAGSNTLLFINGASSNTITHCSLTNATTGATVSSNIKFGTGANQNNTITNTVVNGGNFGIEVNGTAGVLNNNITIKNSTLINQKSTAIILGGATHAGVGNMVIDSNTITHSIASTTGGYQALNVGSIEPSANVYFTRNNVYNINMSAGNFLRGIFVNVAVDCGSLFVRNNSIILGTTTTPNTNSQIIHCLAFYGAGALNLVAEHNTFRIGGTHGTANGNPTTIGILKANTSVLSSFTAKNNISINLRTGTASAHTASFITNPTVGTHDIDFNTYWAPTFMTAWIGNFHNSIVNYKAVAFPFEQNSSFGNLTFTNTTTPVLGANNASSLLAGTPIPAVTHDMYGTLRSTVAPTRGSYESSVPLDTNEVGLTIIYTYGKIPVGTTDTARVLVKNNSVVAITNKYITLTSSLSGFVDSVLVNLPLGAETIINLPPYTPTLLGIDTLTVTVPNDQNNTNNMVFWVRENTLNALSYANPTLGQNGNVGTTGTGEIIAKFYTPVPNFINQVNVNFTNINFNGPHPFQVVIYEDSGSVYGPKKNPIWISPTQNTINGVSNLSIPSVAISDYFYIGIRQTTSNNVGFAFQNENPIRNRTFYFRQGASYATLDWNDFAVNPTNQFRFMIEPRLKINDDLGIVAVSSPNNGCNSTNANQSVKVVVQNMGLLAQDFSLSPVNVYGNITTPSAVTTNFGPILVNSGYLNSDDTLSVEVLNSYDMSASGNYTINAWVKSTIDLNAINDSIINEIRNVSNPYNLPFVRDFNTGTGIPVGITTNRFANTAAIGVNNTNALRVNLFPLNTATANAFISTDRISGVTANTELRFDYKITDFTGGAATVLTNVDSMKILISTDCGLTYNMIYDLSGNMHSPSTNYTSLTIPLGAFAGQDIRIRIDFDWFGTTNDANVDVDNIRVVDKSNDVGIAQSLTPCRSVPLGTAQFTPEIVLNNPGINDQNNVTVYVSITGPVNYLDSIVVPVITSGFSTNVLLANLFNPNTAGTYTLSAWTTLNTDGDPTNDTLVYTFNVTNINLGNTAVNALNVTGTQHAIVKDHPTLNPTDEITIEAWVNSTGTTKRYIMAKDSAFGFVQYSLALNDTNALEFILNTTDGFFVTVSNMVVPSGYHHVAATFDGTKIMLYIDGKITAVRSTNLATIVPNNYDLYIGNSNLLNTPLSGAVDELRVWRVARSEDSIRMNLHTRYANAHSTNLVAYYRMDEATGTVFLTDASGNCNAATMGTAIPTRSAATYALGTPVVDMKNVWSSGLIGFTGTDLSIFYNNFTGEDSVYVHKFDGTPIGTSPVVTPGGITALYPSYWIIYKYGTGSFDETTSNVSFSLMNGSLLSGVVNSDIKLFSRALGNNAGWNTARTAANYTDFNSQTVDFSLTSNTFNLQLAIGGNNNPLPVQLTKLVGSASKADAVLRWSTASESNNKGFVVERSFDGKNFEQITFVKGAINSNVVSNYSFVDKGIFTSNKAAFYRLKQVDLNEEYTYSDVILVTATSSSVENTVVYPNPVNRNLYIEIDSKVNETISITITDITGKTLKTVKSNINEGFNKISIDELETLTQGIYIIQVNTSDKSLYTGKFVKN